MVDIWLFHRKKFLKVYTYYNAEFCLGAFCLHSLFYIKCWHALMVALPGRSSGSLRKLSFSLDGLGFGLLVTLHYRESSSHYFVVAQCFEFSNLSLSFLAFFSLMLLLLCRPLALLNLVVVWRR
jgi:hypothetical protein